MNNLQKARKLKNLSTTEVAKSLGFSKRTIESYESGAREPTIDTLNKLADLYGVSINFLINKEDGIVISENEYLTLVIAKQTIENIMERVNVLKESKENKD